MATVQSTNLDLTALRKLITDVGGPHELSAGCLADSYATCDCAYIFDEAHMGGVGQVFINNGLPVSEGGNDAPSKELAQAYLRLIVGAVNALPALLDIAEGKTHGD